MANQHPDVEACIRSQSIEYRQVTILLGTLRLLHYQSGESEIPPADIIFIPAYTTAGVMFQEGWESASCCYECSTKIKTSVEYTIRQLAASVPIGISNFNNLLDMVL